MLLAAMLLTVSCNNTVEEINVSPNDLYGCWKKVGTQEYWSYRVDATGAKWDASEGFSEDFPSYSYTWSVERNTLQYTTMGDTINVPITRTYTITSIDDEKMVREEELGTYTLVRVEI